ncbi:MAG: ATP-binding cassette domain-containing protein [Deltaproteobacteria bacterium]|nr:ATP-binding cassette domain-containing protein [Deltaproteobacteria bacterium]
MLKVSRVSKAFDGRAVLRDVSFELAAGEQTGIVGPSGGGKSVLLKILGNVLEPDQGSVELSRTSGASGGSRSVGFLFQEGALFDSQSVIENVAFPLLVSRDEVEEGSSEQGSLQGTMSRSDVFERAYTILDEVGLGDAYRKHPGQLSGGMRRRVGIARALVTRPELLLLDDPTGGLDPVAASVIMDLIGELHAAYQPTVLIVSHDLRRLFPHVGRVLGLFNGRLALDCAPAQIAQTAAPEILRFLSTRFDFDSLEARP